MFRKLYLKNFKVWGDQLWDEGVELAPVTLLLGTNSAGKTSLLQALLLLKQTFQSPDPNLDLNLGGQPGDIADFGMFKDIVHDHVSSRELCFGVRYARGSGDHEDTVSYRAHFVSKSGVPVVSEVTLRREYQSAMHCHAATFSLTRHYRGGYSLNASITSHSGDANDQPTTFSSEVSRRFRPERSLFFPWIALDKLKRNRTHVQMTSSRLLNAFRRTYYLGPLREYPKRTYLWSRQRPGEIGPRGEQAVAALLASMKESLANKKRRPHDGGKSVIENVSHWLQQFGIADRLDIKRQGQSRFYDVIIERDGKSSSLVDVGFGVSQVLPMVVMAYFVPSGATIIAEQPELHLHPLAQSALADLMVEVARERQVQFIVETHSEHVFRRLQSLIAAKAVDAEGCRLYFAKRNEAGEAILERLRADAYGRIENWPANFFGDAIGETERQMTSMMERMLFDRGQKQ